MNTYTASTYRPTHIKAARQYATGRAGRKFAGRMILVTLIVLAISSFFVWNAYADNGQPGTAGTPTAAVQKVEVHSGDTLWGIASRHVPQGGNVRTYIEKIVKKNHLNSTKLSVGQLLDLP
jgi:nucleoid-associated protein YgaU